MPSDSNRKFHEYIRCCRVLKTLPAGDQLSKCDGREKDETGYAACSWNPE